MIISTSFKFCFVIVCSGNFIVPKSADVESLFTVSVTSSPPFIWYLNCAFPSLFTKFSSYLATLILYFPIIVLFGIVTVIIFVLLNLALTVVVVSSSSLTPSNVMSVPSLDLLPASELNVIPVAFNEPSTTCFFTYKYNGFCSFMYDESTLISLIVNVSKYGDKWFPSIWTVATSVKPSLSVAAVVICSIVCPFTEPSILKVTPDIGLLSAWLTFLIFTE